MKALKINRLALLIGAVFAFAVAGCGSEREPVPEYDGAMLYLGYCASCHGSAGDGSGPVAKEFDMTMADLRTLRARTDGVFDREAIVTMIEGSSMRPVHGTPEMPVWGWAFYQIEHEMGETHPGRFATARIEALADYLETIQMD